MKNLRSSRAGFSLLEIIIAMSIIAILVGVVGFRSSGAIQRAQASSLVQLVKALEKANAAHYADTGLYPNEYEVTYATTYRQLSGTQTYNGWQGPYIERPLANNDTNPFGVVRQYNTLQANSWVAGFDTDGDGTDDVVGAGCLLYLTGLPEEVVSSIDSAIDGGIPGDWKATGRVVWQQSSNRTLIYIFK
jgi:prepilin-type N-terminal cleavage/methylation domain-containing protein